MPLITVTSTGTDVVLLYKEINNNYTIRIDIVKQQSFRTLSNKSIECLMKLNCIPPFCTGGSMTLRRLCDMIIALPRYQITLTSSTIGPILYT